MSIVKARQALDQFKGQHPQWWNSPSLMTQWQLLQRAYEIALLGYSVV